MKKVVKHAEKYYGKYVTTKSFSSRDVVTFGTSIKDVVKRAKAIGVEDPVCLYVMDPKATHIYSFA